MAATHHHELHAVRGDLRRRGDHRRRPGGGFAATRHDPVQQGLHLPEGAPRSAISTTIRIGCAGRWSAGRRRWREVSWDEAFDLVARAAGRPRAHGRDAIGVYQGNPTAHNLGLLTLRPARSSARSARRTCTRRRSVDQLPHMLAALLMFGNQLLMPVPDIDRTDLFICLGANPLVSNGSIMTAPDMRERLKAIRARGGRVVVVDPRRTETADRRRSSTCSSARAPTRCCCSRCSTCCSPRGLVRLGPLARVTDGLDELRRAAAALRARARRRRHRHRRRRRSASSRATFATRRAPCCYGRIGVCTQEFGGLAAWLVYALNALTGHLDEPGGADVHDAGGRSRRRSPTRSACDGGFARWTQPRARPARVRRRAAGGGARRGDRDARRTGQIRALITQRRQPGAVDARTARGSSARSASSTSWCRSTRTCNETTRHAHVILPPTVAARALALRRSRSTRSRCATSRSTRRRCSTRGRGRAARLGDLPRAGWTRLGRRVAASSLGRLGARCGALGPEALDRARAAHRPVRRCARGAQRLSLAQAARREPHGVDLGPLEPRLPGRLGTPTDARSHLAPREYLDDLARLDAAGWQSGRPVELVLIGRRHLRSNNSWMHNSAAAREGPAALHAADPPDDAAARGLADGDAARCRLGARAIEVPVEVTDEMMPGRRQPAARLGPRPRRRPARRRQRTRARASTTSPTSVRRRAVRNERADRPAGHGPRCAARRRLTVHPA